MCVCSIFDVAKVHVMPRVGSSEAFKTAKKYNQLNWAWDDKNYDPSLFDVSSTLVRSIKAYPLWPWSLRRNIRLEDYLHPEVVSYIQSRGLFMFSPDDLRKQKKHMCAYFLVHILMFGLVALH